jgi:3-O-alpha-D-mannopyranosyl-alpha-D-mannopyranose xylosylphosphotransferase
MEEEGLAVDRGQARRWRDNGELRGAVRSSVQSLGDGMRKVHIVSADYPERPSFDKRQENEESESEEVNIDLESEWLGTSGQIPEWLDWQAQEEGTADKVNWHFHSDIFRLPRDHQGRLVVNQEALGEYELVSYDETSGNETIEGQAEDSIDEEQRLEQAWRELALPSFNSFAIESRVGWITGLNENL